MAGSFGQPNRPRDDGLHDLLSKMFAEILADLLAESGAGVVHGQKNAEDGEGGIEAALLDSFDQVENFSDSFEGEIFALHGDEDLFGRDEGTGHQESDTGRAVENHEVKGRVMAEGVERFPDTEKWVGETCKLDFRAGEVEFRSQDLEVGLPGGLEHVDGAGLAQKNRIKTFAGDEFQSKSAGGVGLGVEIDQENPATCFGCTGSKVDGCGGLPHASFLVYDGNNAHTKGKRRVEVLSSAFP